MKIWLFTSAATLRSGTNGLSALGTCTLRKKIHARASLAKSKNGTSNNRLQTRQTKITAACCDCCLGPIERRLNPRDSLLDSGAVRQRSLKRATTVDVIRNVVFEAHVQDNPSRFYCQHDSDAFAGAQLLPVPQEAFPSLHFPPSAYIAS